MIREAYGETFFRENPEKEENEKWLKEKSDEVKGKAENRRKK